MFPLRIGNDNLSHSFAVHSHCLHSRFASRCQYEAERAQKIKRSFDFQNSSHTAPQQAQKNSKRLTFVLTLLLKQLQRAGS
jgi:hypothetical protein